jgi:hypothetical protein
VGEFIALVSIAVFVWAVVGLINPKAARLPNRITSVGIWLLSVALAVMGGSLMTDDPAEPASEEFAASAPASPTPPPPPRDSAPGAADGAPANNVTAAPSGSPASGNLTAAQRNAVRSANSYFQLSGFSRQGLIDQLSSEFGDRYSVGDATVAVDSLSTDWNAQTARSAVSYLELSGFSCSGLIDQLSSEFGDKYTVEQATYGATQAGIC